MMVYCHANPSNHHHQEMRREHCLEEEGGQQGYVIKDGRLYLDVRDSGNEWIRMVLTRGDAIVLPNTLWR